MSQDQSDSKDLGRQNQELLSETTRVLDNQIQVIQEQQNQATRIIRVLFTALGLLLTLLSIGASTGIINPSALLDNSDSMYGVSLEFLLFLIFIVVSPFIYVLARIFHSALLVLSPSAESHLLSRFLTFSFRKQSRSLSDFLDEGRDRLNKDLAEITPRSGVDSQGARDIQMGEDGNDDPILNYNIGCIYGNELIIKSNRHNLHRIYRSTAYLGTVFGFALFYTSAFVILRAII